MTLETSLAFLDDPSRYGSSYEPTLIRALMRELGHPDRSMKLVHIVGTNGKGSVGAFLVSMLNEAGHDPAGHFSSPHVRRFTERIRIDGKEVISSELDTAVLRLQEALRNNPKLRSVRAFPLQMAASLLCFRQRGVSTAVMEAGIGGAKDSVNALEPSLVLVTTIALDHTDRLGGSVTEIAKEKAGVFRKGVPVISAPQAGPVEDVLREEAARHNAPISFLDPRSIRKDSSASFSRFIWSSPRGEIDLRPKMAGAMQGQNAATAALALFALDPAADIGSVERGAANAFLPGRQQRIGTHPAWVVDGGHNRNAVEALAAEMRNPAATVVIAGMMRDKNTPEIVNLWRSMGNRCILVPVADERSWNPQAVKKELFPDDDCVEIAEDLSEAMDRAMWFAPETIVVGGSLYLAGEALDRLEERGMYHEN